MNCIRNRITAIKTETKKNEHHDYKGHGHHGNGDHHDHMVADFRRRFWISLGMTIPVLILSPLIQAFLGLKDALRFSGDAYVLWVLSSFIFFYGGWPFLKGLFDELGKKQPGMMTLIAVAIGVAYGYSSLVVFGLSGKVFFWELATLIDIMLLGHWIEMKSVMGASRALEALGRLMPTTAHQVMPDGGIRDVSVEEIRPGDKVLIRPGEKVPVDGTVVEGESAVNEAMLTGESKPVEKSAGAGLIGGAIKGAVALADIIREESKQAVSKLKGWGYDA